MMVILNQVTTAEKILELLTQGNARRKTESTDANATSSRLVSFALWEKFLALSFSDCGCTTGSLVNMLLNFLSKALLGSGQGRCTQNHNLSYVAALMTCLATSLILEWSKTNKVSRVVPCALLEHSHQVLTNRNGWLVCTHFSSHAVLEIIVKRKQRNQYRSQILRGKLALVDLAGRWVCLFTALFVLHKLQWLMLWFICSALLESALMVGRQ